MNKPDLVRELQYWLRVIGDRIGADRRFNETINDIIAIIGAPAAQCAPQPSGEPLARDTERFSKFAPEPLAVIPEGTKMALDTRTTLERIADRDAAPPAVSCAAREALDRDIGILLSSFRYFEGAIGETFDDEGGDIARIEADYKARAVASTLPAAGGEASKREADLRQALIALRKAVKVYQFSPAGSVEASHAARDLDDALDASAALAVVPDERGGVS